MTGKGVPRGLTVLALTAVLLAAVLWLDRDFFRRPEALAFGRHAAISLEIAVHRQRFGEQSVITDHPLKQAGIRALLMDPARDHSGPVADFPERLADSTEAYASRLVPILNNENSLMLLDYALLRLAPGVTLEGLRLAHLGLIVACLSAFALVLVWEGFSPLLAGAVLHLGLLVVGELNRTQPLAVYPLLAPALLLYLALLGAALAAGAHRRIWTAAGALAVVGLAAGFLCNLRTSYAPITAVLLLLYALVAALDLRRRGAGGWRVALVGGLGLVAFGGGYRLFSAACIDPIKEAPVTADFNYAHHVIGHPLVLSLALAPPPHDALAQREGIAWDDLCGLKLARRIDPAVRYLDGHYDAALLTYYLKLWLYYPDEMGHVYAAKLDRAGVDCFRYLNDLATAEQTAGKEGLGTISTWLRWPLRLLARGSQWLLALAVLAVLAVLAGRRLGPAAAFTLAGLAAAAALLLLEAAAVLSGFYLPHQSPLLLCVLLAGLAPYQLGLDLALRLGRAAGRRVGRLLRWGGTGAEEAPAAPPRAAA
jgi:hypothetical protein